MSSSSTQPALRRGRGTSAWPGHNMAGRPAQVFGVSAAALIVCYVCIGCEGPPARQRPWRHAPDPTEEAATAETPAADRLRERAENQENRRRTLRIRVSVEPAQLSPLLDPDVDTARVLDGTV